MNERARHDRDRLRHVAERGWRFRARVDEATSRPACPVTSTAWVKPAICRTNSSGAAASAETVTRSRASANPAELIVTRYVPGSSWKREVAVLIRHRRRRHGPAPRGPPSPQRRRSRRASGRRSARGARLGPGQTAGIAGRNRTRAERLDVRLSLRVTKRLYTRPKWSVKTDRSACRSRVRCVGFMAAWRNSRGANARCSRGSSPGRECVRQLPSCGASVA